MDFSQKIIGYQHLVTDDCSLFTYQKKYLLELLFLVMVLF
jgi:hypothetical protein